MNKGRVNPKRLGRGLANLIPEAPMGASPVTTPPQGLESELPFRMIGIDSISLNPDQPRQHFDEAALAALAESIATDGVLTPILVKPMGQGNYQLVAGERRWRACQRAGVTEIPAYLRDGDDVDRLAWALAENLNRADLSAMEVAEGLGEMSERGLTHEQISARMGMSRPAVSNYLRLRGLERSIRVLLGDGTLTAGHGRAILMLEEAKDRVALAEEIVRKGLSVRGAEKRAKAMGTVASQAPSKTGPTENPALRRVRQRFEDALGTKVDVRSGRKGSGTVQIHFSNAEELTRILDQIEREL